MQPSLQTGAPDIFIRSLLARADRGLKIHYVKSNIITRKYAEPAHDLLRSYRSRERSWEWAQRKNVFFADSGRIVSERFKP